MANLWGESPRDSVAGLVRARGSESLVRACCALLDEGEVEAEILLGLAGAHAQRVLNGAEGGVEGYWPRVWSLRALLYTWSDIAGSSVIRATHDPSWRVREMALKVVRAQRIQEASPAVVTSLEDPVERVVLAAHRALRALEAPEG